MDTHVKVLGVLHIVLGALGLIGALLLVLVFGGVAQGRISFEADDKKREALLREGVRDLLKRYPPKK